MYIRRLRRKWSSRFSKSAVRKWRYSVVEAKGNCMSTIVYTVADVARKNEGCNILFEFFHGVIGAAELAALSWKFREKLLV